MQKINKKGLSKLNRRHGESLIPFLKKKNITIKKKEIDLQDQGKAIESKDDEIGEKIWKWQKKTRK